MLDDVMPIENGFYANCSKYPIVYGPKSIYQRMKSLGICVEGNYDASGNHVSNPSLENVYYIPEKLVCFFKKYCVAIAKHKKLLATIHLLVPTNFLFWCKKIIWKQFQFFRIQLVTS